MEQSTVLPVLEASGADRRRGPDYVLEAADVEAYKRDGYIRLPGLLTEEEVAEIEKSFDKLTAGEVEIPGKDFCDMSQPFGVPYEQWRLVNVMLPRQYFSPLQGNMLEQRAGSVARQLLGDDMEYDYDQLLLKRPAPAHSGGEQNGAVFAWHQDQAYWPQDVPDSRTVTVSLALNTADTHNGCLRVVPGSHREPSLRQHRPAGGSRSDSHALTVDLLEGDRVLYLPLRRGDVTVHDERIVHGSDGNRSTSRPRKTYVIAFRPQVTIAYERSLGFNHSHNTEVNWDSWITAQAKQQQQQAADKKEQEQD